MSKKFCKKKKMRYVEFIPMRYDAPSEILYTGKVKGYNVAIINCRCEHPCAYVQVPTVIADLLERELDVHGGVTFTSSSFWRDGDYEKEGYTWIGWDYAHLGDYRPPIKGRPHLYKSYKKWTTEEVYRDIISAVKQIRQYWRDVVQEPMKKGYRAIKRLERYGGFFS